MYAYIISHFMTFIRSKHFKPIFPLGLNQMVAGNVETHCLLISKLIKMFSEVIVLLKTKELYWFQSMELSYGP